MPNAHSQDIITSDPILAVEINSTPIAEWDRTTNYSMGSLCTYNGALWESLTANNHSMPPKGWRKLT